MKKFLRAVGYLIMGALLLEGALLLADYLHKNYGKKYVVSEITEVE